MVDEFGRAVRWGIGVGEALPPDEGQGEGAFVCFEPLRPIADADSHALADRLRVRDEDLPADGDGLARQVPEGRLVHAVEGIRPRRETRRTSPRVKAW